MTKTSASLNKLMSQVFAPIDNVVWDLTTNATGIKRSDGIYTLSGDNEIELNPFDAFSMELPAFSQLVPVDQVQRGDVMVSNGKATGWILETKTTKAKDDKPSKTSLQALSFNGHQTQFRPKAVKMMGMSGVSVVRSPFNFDSNAAGSGEGATNPFGDMSALMPLMMLQGNGTGSSIDMKTMALMSMMGSSGGSGGFGGMNPMMLMMLLGDDAGFLNK